MKEEVIKEELKIRPNNPTIRIIRNCQEISL